MWAHGEVVGCPSLPKQGGGGDATASWETGNEDGKRGTKKKHGCFQALDLVLLGAAVDEDQYLAHTSCIWFLHGQRTWPILCNWVSTEMCRRRSADVSRYSYLHTGDMIAIFSKWKIVDTWCCRFPTRFRRDEHGGNLVGESRCQAPSSKKPGLARTVSEL